MIIVNMLPDDMRKKESMPLPQFLGILGGIVAFAVLGFFIINYMWFIIPEMQARKNRLRSEETALKNQAKEYDDMTRQINEMTDYIDTVRSLYLNRTVWSKVLADLKSITNFDNQTGQQNAENKYIWMTKIVCNDSVLGIDGIASGPNEQSAMEMLQRMLRNMRDVSANVPPEQRQLRRLEQELLVAREKHEQHKDEDPTLPDESEEIISLRSQVALLRSSMSGGIATKPFASQIDIRSINPVRQEWRKAPVVSEANRGGVTTIELPHSEYVWNFTVSMKLKGKD